MSSLPLSEEGQRCEPTLFDIERFPSALTVSVSAEKGGRREEGTIGMKTKDVKLWKEELSVWRL